MYHNLLFVWRIVINKIMLLLRPPSSSRLAVSLTSPTHISLSLEL